MLIDKTWANFFKENNFSIGISLDVPRHLNDIQRVTKNNKGTFDLVLARINLCRDAGLNVGVCVTLHKHNYRHDKEIYAFMAENDLPFTIIPMMKSGAGRDTYDSIGLEPEDYAVTWIEMYNAWINEDPGYVHVSDLADRTHAVLTGRPQGCWTEASCCDSYITVDPVGDVYACASVSANLPALYGNLKEDNLEQLMLSKNAVFWRTRQHAESCKKCEWFHVCHGGCMARAYKFFNEIDTPDYYCASLKKIYSHITSTLENQGMTAAQPHPNHFMRTLPDNLRGQFSSPRKIIPLKIT